MKKDELIEGISGLQSFVNCLRSAGVSNRTSYREFIKNVSDSDFEMLNCIFGFDKLPPNPKRPKIGSLVSAHFHPDLPLIGFNYTPVAHNTLHTMPESWTPALRLCRGIVFDLETAELLALPFEKFFNYGEHPETSNLAAVHYFASEKHDGHLGIIFRYKGQLLITTRGDFSSPTSIIAKEMLQGYRSLISLPSGCTGLVEIIHPQTRVIRDYNNEEKFVLIGCRRNPLVNHIEGSVFQEAVDYSYEELNDLGGSVHLEVARALRGGDVNELLQEICRRDITNREGWVATIDDGQRTGCRVKFKYVNYIGEMVRRKLSYQYLMNRAVAGNLEKMIATLPEEIYDEALKMLGRISIIMFVPGDAKSKRRRLYELLPEDMQTDSFKNACRAFAKAFTSELQDIEENDLVRKPRPKRKIMDPAVKLPKGQRDEIKKAVESVSGKTDKKEKA